MSDFWVAVATSVATLLSGGLAFYAASRQTKVGLRQSAFTRQQDALAHFQRRIGEIYDTYLGTLANDYNEVGAWKIARPNEEPYPSWETRRREAAERLKNALVAELELVKLLISDSDVKAQIEKSKAAIDIQYTQLKQAIMDNEKLSGDERVQYLELGDYIAVSVSAAKSVVELAASKIQKETLGTSMKGMLTSASRSAR